MIFSFNVCWFFFFFFWVIKGLFNHWILLCRIHSKTLLWSFSFICDRLPIIHAGMLYAWWHVAVQWLAKNVHNCIRKLKEEEEEEEEEAAAACNGSSHICLSICRWCINQKNFPPIRQFSLFKFGNIVTNLWSRGLNNQSLTTTGTN